MCPTSQQSWLLATDLPRLKPNSWDKVEGTLYMFLGMVHRVHRGSVVLSATLVLQPLLLAQFLVGPPCLHAMIA